MLVFLAFGEVVQEGFYCILFRIVLTFDWCYCMTSNIQESYCGKKQWRMHARARAHTHTLSLSETGPTMHPCQQACRTLPKVTEDPIYIAQLQQYVLWENLRPVSPRDDSGPLP